MAPNTSHMENIELKQKLVNKGEIAVRYGVSTRTIQCWMEQRRIPYLKLGYMVRFDPEACDQALARFNVSSTARNSRAALSDCPMYENRTGL
jgi:excisionase family DNA binding protein